MVPATAQFFALLVVSLLLLLTDATVLHAIDFGGANGGERVQAAINALPEGGGTVVLP